MTDQIDPEGRDPASSGVKRWVRQFDANMGQEPVPGEMVNAHGLHLPAGRFTLRLEPIGKKASAFAVNKWDDGTWKWCNSLYLLLPRPVPGHPACQRLNEKPLPVCALEHFTRFQVATAYFHSRQDAQQAFNDKPEDERSFTLVEAATIVVHIGFDYSGNAGEVRLIIEQVI